MSRRKTRPEEIRDPKRYFNKYVAKEVAHGLEERGEYYETNRSLEEILEGGEEGISRSIQMHLATNVDGSDLERMLEERSTLAWIDGIENEVLYNAIVSLSFEDCCFLTYRYRLCLTQQEIAQLLHINQSNVSRKEERLIKYLKEFLEKAHRKP